MISLEGGIVGLSENTRFVLLDPEDDESSFRWLQSLDDPAIAFVVADPFDLFANYEPEIPDEDLEILGINSPEDIALICVLTVPGDIRSVTANLLAPIVVNVETRRGKQIILTNSSYRTKHRLFDDVQPEQGQ